MIIEFNVGEDANLLEHELTRQIIGFPSEIITVWVAPGVFRLVGSQEELRRIIEERWATLPDLPPAKLIRSE